MTSNRQSGQACRSFGFAMQVGWCRPVHLKHPEASKLRLLLSSQEMLVRMRSLRCTTPMPRAH
jgi:hypothetical protein